MRPFFLSAGTLTGLAALYFLYQRQLGAISFFIFSILFFYLTFTELSKREALETLDCLNEVVESEKSEENDR